MDTRFARLPVLIWPAKLAVETKLARLGPVIVTAPWGPPVSVRFWATASDVTAFAAIFPVVRYPVKLGPVIVTAPWGPPVSERFWATASEVTATLDNPTTVEPSCVAKYVVLTRVARLAVDTRFARLGPVIVTAPWGPPVSERFWATASDVTAFAAIFPVVIYPVRLGPVIVTAPWGPPVSVRFWATASDVIATLDNPTTVEPSCVAK